MFSDRTSVVTSIRATDGGVVVLAGAGGVVAGKVGAADAVVVTPDSGTASGDEQETRNGRTTKVVSRNLRMVRIVRRRRFTALWVNRALRPGCDTFQGMTEQRETVLWVARDGRFLLETGYFAEVPCSRCKTRSEISIDGAYYCQQHHDRGELAPEWVRVWHAR